MAATLANGRRGGRLATFGNAVGILVHVVAVATGIAALLQVYPAAFQALKWAGVAFLGWLGLRTFMQPPVEVDLDEADVGRVGEKSGAGIFRDGVLMAVLNPKIAVLMLALLPQFVDFDSWALPQIATLGTIHVLVASITLTIVATFTVAIEQRLRDSPAWARALQWTTGAALLGFAIALALLGTSL